MERQFIITFSIYYPLRFINWLDFSSRWLRLARTFQLCVNSISVCPWRGRSVRAQHSIWLVDRLGSTTGFHGQAHIRGLPVPWHCEGSIPNVVQTGSKLPLLVSISDPSQPSTESGNSTSLSQGLEEYESFLALGKLDFKVKRPEDECDPISISYTSGTTSSPKGVIYSHRGASLNYLAAALLSDLRSTPASSRVFHCSIVVVNS